MPSRWVPRESLRYGTRVRLGIGGPRAEQLAHDERERIEIDREGIEEMPPDGELGITRLPEQFGRGGDHDGIGETRAQTVVLLGSRRKLSHAGPEVELSTDVTQPC